MRMKRLMSITVMQWSHLRIKLLVILNVFVSNFTDIFPLDPACKKFYALHLTCIWIDLFASIFSKFIKFSSNDKHWIPFCQHFCMMWCYSFDNSLYPKLSKFVCKELCLIAIHMVAQLFANANISRFENENCDQEFAKNSIHHVW